MSKPQNAPIRQGKQTFAKVRPPKKVPEKRAPQQKKQKERKRKEKPGTTIQLPTVVKNMIDQVNIVTPYNMLSTQEMMSCFTSYFITKGFIDSQTIDNEVFYRGMLYLWQGFSQAISGQPALENRPKIINDLIAAFSPKSIPFHDVGKISYAWDNVNPVSSGLYSPGWGNWNFVQPGVDNEQYDAPASVYTPPSNIDVKDYNTLLNYIQAVTNVKSDLLKTISSSTKSELQFDASAFSRCYGYLGLTPANAGGFWNDIELEVAIKTPTLAHNVSYQPGVQDRRVPQYLTKNSGGPSFNLMPLVPSFDHWSISCPPCIKYIDFFEIVNTLIYWYVESVQLRIADLGTYDPSNFQFAFTYQDFCIAVRQALLSAVFVDQYMVQFVGPLAYDSGNNATNFVPFQVLGNCYGTDKAASMLIPNILRENFAALRTQKLTKRTRRGGLLEKVYIPCLGFYQGDIAEIWNINLPVEPGIFPLFADTTQAAINLVNCTEGNNYINVNGFHYGSVMESWNEKVQGLKAETNVSTLKTIQAPHNSMIMQVTRQIDTIPEVGYRKRLADLKWEYPALKWISNVGYKMKPPSKNDLKKLPQLPGPATATQLTNRCIMAAFPLTVDVDAFLRYMVVPSIRFDPNGSNDLLNQPMYQVITGEVINAPNLGIASTEPDYLGRQHQAGTMLIQGLAKTTNSDFDTIFAKLAGDGSGGALASILGGFAKQLFPSASGVIDTVASFLP